MTSSPRLRPGFRHALVVWAGSLFCYVTVQLLDGVLLFVAGAIWGGLVLAIHDWADG